MKRNIGSTVGLYPTPSTVVGTLVNGKVNWSNIAHIGIIGLDCILLSIHKQKYTNIGIKENMAASINLINEDMVVKADYVGMVSGKSTDKSEVFEYEMGVLNVPIIKDSPLAMECELVDIYDTGNYENFILKVVHTHVEEYALTDDGKINYEKVNPLLFEMPTQSYFSMGSRIAKCWNVGKEFKVK
jgi:flavin reductase (DIM6/NTAB) family NADH-FMN oxidoreductase RutF